MSVSLWPEWLLCWVVCDSVTDECLCDLSDCWLLTGVYLCDWWVSLWPKWLLSGVYLCDWRVSLWPKWLLSGVCLLPGPPVLGVVGGEGQVAHTSLSLSQTSAHTTQREVRPVLRRDTQFDTSQLERQYPQHAPVRSDPSHQDDALLLCTSWLLVSDQYFSLILNFWKYWEPSNRILSSILRQ